MFLQIFRKNITEPEEDISLYNPFNEKIHSDVSYLLIYFAFLLTPFLIFTHAPETTVSLPSGCRWVRRGTTGHGGRWVLRRTKQSFNTRLSHKVYRVAGVRGGDTGDLY